MNTKIDKLEFLKAIASGQIKPEDVPENPIIVSEKREMFLGWMIRSSQVNEGDVCPIFFVGEAKRAYQEMVQRIRESRNEVSNQ